ncbi:DUF898 family protein [Bradyrhizobium sp.]|uniref:DUF898 family protein n=1 Tax=Bradyrhizobium sp. TaxID=376 RepID=UPI003C3176A2
MSFVGQPPPLPPVPVSYIGRRGDFFRLVARGAALELVTVGFYRFWLATDIRRHLWSHTLVDGDAAEYTGRGKELLLGFLFALAILVPIYLAYFLIGIEAERLKAFGGLPLLIAFFAFGQFAIYRARRYRLTRTVWRGVRFWMDGSGWAYAGRAMLWGALVLLTLGLALPWREAALERYKMSHSHYGELQGRFEGQGWEFFKRAWWLWLCAPLALVLFPLAPFLYAEFKAVEWRWWLSGIRFGGLRLESTLPRRALYGLYWKVIGWFLLLSVSSAAYFGFWSFLFVKMNSVTRTHPVTHEMMIHSIPIWIMMGLGYLALILSLNVVMRLYLLRDVWATTSASVELHGIEAVANVAAKGDLASALGEGFADGLDVAGF